MTTFALKFKLTSDTTFGRGDGVSGEVDAEVMHDEWGFPYLGGRAIKGILVNECADILAALPADERKKTWEDAAARLFGQPGSCMQEAAILSFGDAQLPADLRAYVIHNLEQQLLALGEALGPQTSQGEKNKTIQRRKALLRKETLDSLTTVRQQTAMEMSGVPKEHSLRVQRVILRETPFEASLEFSQTPGDAGVGLLQACVMAFRRAGTSRNRGRGTLDASLWKDGQCLGKDSPFYLLFKKDYLPEVKS